MIEESLHSKIDELTAAVRHLTQEVMELRTRINALANKGSTGG